MIAPIRIDNFPTDNIKERTILDADTIVGATSLTTKNTSGIANGDLLVVGPLGGIQAELITLAQAPNADSVTLTVPALKFVHKRFEDVTAVKYNQIKVYRAANVDGSVPADGAFTAYGPAITIGARDGFTDYVDTNGGSGYWYKWTYFNSATSAETNLSDREAIQGASANQYTETTEVRRAAGLLNNKWITDETILRYIRAASDHVNGALEGLYTVPFQHPVNPIIEDLTKRIAVGKILLEEFGPTDTGAKKQGQGKLDETDQDIKDLQTKQVVLVNAKGVGEEIYQAGGIKYWPNNTTADQQEADAGGDRLFRISHEY